MARKVMRMNDGLCKKKEFEHGVLKNVYEDKYFGEPVYLSQKHPVPFYVYCNRYSREGKKSNSSKSGKVKQWYGIRHRIYYTGEYVLSYFHYQWAEFFYRIKHTKCELFKELGVIRFKNKRVTPFLPTIYELNEESNIY
uniref:Group I intron endonuclease n=1 Tax=Parastrongyloides trichosuri TaxID=131310 RepID=A0A0N5A4B6_PARTI